MLLFLVAVSSVFLIWRYYDNHKNYWRNRGIGGPPPKFLLGHFYELFDYQNPCGLVIREWTKKYGKLYGAQEGFYKVLIVSDIKLVQELMSDKFDDFHGRKLNSLRPNVDNDPRTSLFHAQGLRWKRLRTLSAYSFSTNHLKKVLPTIEDSAIELVRLLKDHADGEAINIHSFMQEYTMDVISRIAMGQNGSRMFNNPNKDLANIIFKRNLASNLYVGAAIFPQIRLVFLLLFYKLGSIMRKAAGPIYGSIIKTVDERLEMRKRDAVSGLQKEEPNDYVDFFLDAEVDEKAIGWEAEFKKTGAKVSRVLTREEIIESCFLFLLAGFEGTANILAITCWLLAKHPEVQRRVQQEIEQVCGLDEYVPYEALAKMKYTEAVMNETLRMYPVASFINSRTAMKNTTLGDTPVEKGTLVQVDVWSLHYDKEIWGENAEEFVPERWEDENLKHNPTWMPFGSGPRVCIGMRLAYMEEKLALVHILRKFNIASGPATEKNLRLLGASTVAPESTTVYLRKIN